MSLCISRLTDCLLCLTQYTNRAANHYTLVVADCAWGHCTMLLCSWSYHSALPHKNIKKIFSISCACGHQLHQQPVASVPFLCMWCWLCHIGIHTLNRLTNCSVQLGSCYYVSVPGETTSVLVISNGHTEASCRVINLIKKAHAKLGRKNMSTEKFQCIVRPASEVQCWIHGTLMLPVAECMMSSNASAGSITSTKEKP